MDADLSALAATAATTLVGLLTTDAWERVKGGLGALWRRAYPERAKTIEAEITEARGELLAPGAADDEQLIRGLVDEWESRIYRLLISKPDLAEPLHRLLDDELTPALAATGVQIENYTVNATASGHGRVNVVAKGDQWNVKP